MKHIENMKKTIFILMAAAGLCSCDAFLDEPMKGDYSSGNIYSTEEQAELAVNAVYNAAAYCINLWKFGDVASDDSEKGGNPGDQADIGYIDEWNVLSDNGAVAEFWQNTYETISRANNAISGIEASGISDDAKSRLTAEAKFLRAFSYFQLVNIFGEVPLKLLPQSSVENVHVGLSSVEKIYGQIEQDLIDAQVLPATYAGEDAGRVTKGAAYGLLAKVQLYQGKYEDALTSISNLKQLKLYDLEQDYSALFRLGEDGESNGNSIESIFAIFFLSDQVPAMGNALNQWFAPAAEGGYYFNAPTQDWVDCFDEQTESGEEDPRIDASIGRDGKEWFEQGEFNAEEWAPATGYLVKKFNQPLSQVSSGRKGDGGLAYIYLRYADILLMEAECQNELHHPDLAEDPLNLVRGRAGLQALEGQTEDAMRDAIRTERRRELGFEFHRFFDLMRWGEEAAKEALGNDFPWSEPRYWFPLPQSEVDSNLGISK